MNDNPPASIVVGASSGIGRSLALALARDRQRVALIGRHQESLDRVAGEVRAFGGEALVAVSDVREPETIEHALEAIAAQWPQPQTVYLSSGIALPVDLEYFHAGPLEQIVQTNLLGVAHWLEALHPRLRGTGSTVVVISSLSADRAFPGGGAAYSASKAAVSQLCDGLRAPWSRQGVRLVTVSPGFIRTPMTDGMASLPLVMEPEDAAKVILRGVANGKTIIRFPTAAAVTMGLVRLLPAVILDKFYRP
ncbi:oxidoreductase [Capsulimonas corticalis]|uniref:Oxidoreductase n=1 Tax=Capsulimonas corticalis TaxID=2219043 RepID=A0A402CNV0_9BACT|nr:SDR family NAD(P)-dependent oxidoreductase [Capsulimonas corticalis]BDI33266.1 oxidoreductase [Capsulimonas corticalis]